MQKWIHISWNILAPETVKEIDPSVRFCSCGQSQNLKDVTLFLKVNIPKNDWIDNGNCQFPTLTLGTVLVQNILHL